MGHEPRCKICNHVKSRHFDLIDEDSGGNLRADYGCWICGDDWKVIHRYEETRNQ